MESELVKRLEAYVQAALDGEIDRLSAQRSGRRCGAFRAAAALCGFVAGGYLDADEVTALLLDAALAIGIPERAARRHIRRGLLWGARTPRVVPDRATRRARTTIVPRPA